MIRFGLCCIFRDQPIKFRRTTARYLSGLPRSEQKDRLAGICLDNAHNLMAALAFCRANRIGGFRINSQILPLKTHPQAGYDLADLPYGDRIMDAFRQCGAFAREYDIRTTFHPDQFIVLSSPDPSVVSRSLADLAYQSQVADWVGADVINIHGGGAYGDKPAALARLKNVIAGLPPGIRSRLTLENDDRTYTPGDLLPVCRETGIPLVYDVHHHRCLPDTLDVAQATGRALSTWDREPLFHMSSPVNGWHGPDIRSHHDYVNITDFPDEWRDLDITVEVEAKAKELAVIRLIKDLQGNAAG